MRCLKSPPFHENLRGPPQKFVEKDGSKKVWSLYVAVFSPFAGFSDPCFLWATADKSVKNAFREFERGWVKCQGLVVSVFGVCIVHSEWV